MYTSQLAELKTKGGQLQFNIGDTLDFSSFSFAPRGFGGAWNFPSIGAGDDYRDTIGSTAAPLGVAQVGGTVAGSIGVSGDRDIFSISLTAGQTYTFDLKAASGSGLDSYVRLLNSSGSQLAVNDDFGGSLNSRITFTASQTGTYYIEARDYSRGTGAYNLTVGGSGGPVTPTDDYRDSLTDTTAPFGTVAIGGSTSGRVEVGGDADIFSISLTAGQSYTFKLDAASTGGLSDPSLRLLSSSGTQLAANNDFGSSKNSQITFTATSTGTYYLEAKGATSTLTGAYSVSAAQNAPPATGGFDIKVNYTGDQQYAAIFEQAAARWEAAITTDIPDYQSSRYGLIDDLLIDASAVYIDGAGSVLGRAGPDEFRSGSYLPAHGIMEFDSADLAGMAANGTLLGVIIHEMGHVLGLGTLWDTKGLKSGNFNYTGANALAEYRVLSGNPNATSIPLETTGGQGTAGSHWSESVFGGELMTGYASGGMQMSRMTIGALADLGYGVNYGAAQAYTLPGRLNGLMAAESHAQHDEIFGIV